MDIWIFFPNVPLLSDPSTAPSGSIPTFGTFGRGHAAMGVIGFTRFHMRGLDHGLDQVKSVWSDVTLDDRKYLNKLKKPGFYTFCNHFVSCS